MPGLTTATELDPDSGIRVVVTPSQSSYFAGEPFTVTVTFTNTHSPDASPLPGSSRPSGHKRGAHSISSAPLARPPTSPGIGPPKSSIPGPSSSSLGLGTGTHNKEDVPLVRKGLIGKVPSVLPLQKGGADEVELPELLEQRRKRLLAKSKSLSVSIAPHEFEEQVGGEATIPAPNYAQGSFDPRISPTSPRISSPLTRSDTLPLGAKHPHARKQSVAEGQAEISSPAPSQQQSSYTPASSTSTFSLALDPIVEGVTSPYPSTPSLVSPTFETGPSHHHHANSNTVYAYPPPRSSSSSSSRRHSHAGLGLGHGQPPSSLKLNPGPPPSSASTTHPRFPPTAPNTELILYSYAQLKGFLSLTPLPNVHLTQEQKHTLNATRSALLRRSVVGGGRMDISASLHSSSSSSHPNSAGLITPGSAGLSIGPGQGSLGQSQGPGHRRRPTHSRSSSFSTGLLNLLSPSSPSTSISFSPFPPSPLPYPDSAGSVGSPSSHPYSNPSPHTHPQHQLPLPSPLGPGIPNKPNPRLGHGHGHRSRPSTAGLSPGPTSRFPSSPVPSNNTLGHLSSPIGLGLGMSMGMGEEDIDPEVPLPTFEVQPAMLAVDLLLAPGESKSYTYTLPLPDVLPPTFKGRTLKFSYELEVGTCRAGTGVGTSTSSTTPSAMSENSVSRVMKVPIRVYNNVVVGRTIKPYEILWPLSKAATMPVKDMQGKVVEVTSKHGSVNGAKKNGGLIINGTSAPSAVQKPPPSSLLGTFTDLQDYARRLLASFPEVAVLTFTKAAYRLGETVLGVVEINERKSRSRVLQLSAILESHESLPSSISPSLPTRILRRVHAEHHTSFLTSTIRTTFSLDIPSDASPNFQLHLGPPQPGAPPTTPGGLEWKVRLCLLVAVCDESAREGTEGVRMRGMVRVGERGEWGSGWVPTKGLAPLEKVREREVGALGAAAAAGTLTPTQTPRTPMGWGAFLVGSLFGNGMMEGDVGMQASEDGDDQDDDDDDDGVEDGYDGIKPDLLGGVGKGVDFGGGEGGWRDVKMETVECEVPIKMWPGNTAFKAADIVFDV
ncbi:hypothetical protein H0H93_009157 [Arthromyces matolae]|nr:hypothetical protein H0H93_009157 [Arthromyces matolae]